jgi:hypothetical protein
MAITVLTPLKWGVSWGLRHPWETIAGYVLLKNPATRGLMVDHLILLGRGALAGTRGSYASIFNRIISPGAKNIGPRILRGAQVAASSGAAPIVAAATVAAVGAAGVTAAQHKVGLIGPKAIKIPSPIMSLDNIEFNPFFMGWGSVV